MFESTDQRMEIPALELTQTHAVAEGQEPVGITLKDLLIEVGIEDAHSNGSRLGKELRRLDWHKRRVLKDKVQRTLWFPPRRTVEACARCQGVLDSHGDCPTCEMDRPIETRRARLKAKAEELMREHAKHPHDGIHGIDCELCKLWDETLTQLIANRQQYLLEHPDAPDELKDKFSTTNRQERMPNTGGVH